MSKKVSAVFLCYNCEAFVADAVRSVLAQDYSGPMEIILSDDASTDRTFEIVRHEIDNYGGPHSVKLLRRMENAGSKSAHLAGVFEHVTGDILISFDDDDVSVPSRVSRILDAFQRDPRVRAVYSSFTQINEKGRQRSRRSVVRPLEAEKTRYWFANVDAYAPGATLAVAREIFEKFPPLDGVAHEDVVLPFRASLLGEVAFIDEPLVRARRHTNSLTADSSRFASLESLRARVQWGIARARLHADIRMADIDRAVQLCPDRDEDWRKLRNIVRDSVANAERTAGLVHPTLLKRLTALAQVLQPGSFRGELIQAAAIALAPKSYLWYKRRSLHLGPRRANSEQGSEPEVPV